MPFASGASQLPVEILSMVLGDLDIHQLLKASHVCAKWHAVARAEPLFWRDVRLAALSTTALDFFQARLDYPAPRPIFITLHLADHPACAMIRSVVFPAISRHLHRLVYLGLDVHSDVAQLVLETLACSAPVLKTFSLRFFHCNKKQLPVLSSDLLCGSSNLHSVTLSDVQLPGSQISAFKSVYSLVYKFTHARVFPSDLFEHFPELHWLVVVGKSFLPPASSEDEKRLVTPPSLSDLEIYLSQCTYEPVVLSIPNLASIRNIVCEHPRNGITQLLVDHLQGPLEFSLFRLREGLVHINLYAPENDRVRMLVEYDSHVVEDLPRAVLFAPDLLERITLLRICDELAYLAPHLDEMPSCHTLDIIVDKAGRPLPTLDLSAPLRLPALKTVLVATDEERPTTLVPIDADALHAFLTQLLGALAKRPLLRLQGVRATGNTEALFRDFEPESQAVLIKSICTN